MIYTKALLIGAALFGWLVGCSSKSSSTSDASGGKASETSAGGSSSSMPGEGGASSGGASSSGATALDDGLGAYPVEAVTETEGGTMTFTDVGAPGYWARRLDRDAGDPACDLKDGLDTWGGHCCLARHDSDSKTLAPFDEEMTLLVKMVDVKQLAVYQPTSTDSWGLVSAWDSRAEGSSNLWFSASGDGSASFPGDLREQDCVWYVNQKSAFDCGDGRDYFCPNDPGILHRGWSGSKLLVLLVDFTVDDTKVKSCSGDGAGHPGPWVALVASELTRDGGRKWNGACNCYSRTGTVGDGCGEINLFEVVMDNNDWSNREFASTGLRSYQAGHVGGNVCGTGCARSQFPSDQDVVDACAKTDFVTGPTLPMGGQASGCPVWLRPEGFRYLVVLLDETRRLVQVALVNPGRLPVAASALLPALPRQLSRESIDALADLRLPSGD